MTQPIGSAAEAELAIERLLDKLEAWILQQPEALLIWAQPRGSRKAASHLIAEALCKIPAREGQAINRDTRRRLLKEIERQEKEWWKGVEL